MTPRIPSINRQCRESGPDFSGDATTHADAEGTGDGDHPGGNGDRRDDRSAGNVHRRICV